MSVRVPVAALLACALLAVPAAAQSPDDQPMLTQDPPTQLGGEPTPTPTATATPSPSAEPGEELADTGADPGLLALAGLSLLGMGLSLRLAVPDGAPG